MAVQSNPSPSQQAQAQVTQAQAQAQAQAQGQFAQSDQQSPGVVSQHGQQIPPAPLLHLVQPGDLITAQYFNDLVLAVQNLQARVEELEAPQYYRAQSDQAMAAAS